jgi:hypothetical protein
MARSATEWSAHKQAMDLTGPRPHLDGRGAPRPGGMNSSLITAPYVSTDGDRCLLYLCGAAAAVNTLLPGPALLTINRGDTSG